MAPKKITVQDDVSGERTIMVTESTMEIWLGKFRMDSFVDKEKVEIIDFECLVDGETYQRGPPLRVEQQQEKPASPHPEDSSPCRPQRSAESAGSSSDVVHGLMTLPPFKKFQDSTMVDSVNNAGRPCVGCRSTVRTYCVCSPGLYRCKKCLMKHQVDALKNVNPSIAHALRTLPHFKRFQDSTIVDSVLKYSNRRCLVCKSGVRTYCACSPGIHLCKKCFPAHHQSRMGSGNSAAERNP